MVFSFSTQFLCGQIHGGSSDTGDPGHNSQRIDAHHKLQKANSGSTDAAGQIYLKTGAHEPEDQIHKGQQQRTVKNRQVQKNPSLVPRVWGQGRE